MQGRIEPASEGHAEHDGPLAGGESDGALVGPGLLGGASMNVTVGVLHPAQVAVAVGGLAAVDTVAAVDLVDVPGAVATEVLEPAHSVEAADGVG